MTLSSIKPGQQCRVSGSNGPYPDRLLEMGVLPGTLLEVVRFAPLGDPIAVRVDRSQLAIRRADAEHILVQSA